MRRRSSAGGEPLKARRPKTATLKRPIESKSARRSSAAGHETEIARLTRERHPSERLQRRAARYRIVASVCCDRRPRSAPKKWCKSQDK
jgi:hypothetical protein